MRLPQRALLSLACALAYACGDADGQLGDDNSGLSAAGSSDSDQEADEAGPSGGPESSAGSAAAADLTVDDLACVRGGGQVGEVRVAFACGEITIVSCKDLSNVVLEFADGSRQRFEGLKGQRDVFSGTGKYGGAVITGVWVKAGSNHSGDGPGYGERFDAPTQTCPPPGECTVADGSCNPTKIPPPPPPKDDCFVADGSCDPSTPPPPPPPPSEDPMVI
jgi:hypothetical protein